MYVWYSSFFKALGCFQDWIMLPDLCSPSNVFQESKSCGDTRASLSSSEQWMIQSIRALFLADGCIMPSTDPLYRTTVEADDSTHSCHPSLDRAGRGDHAGVSGSHWVAF
ncbi:hypothetical protein GWK47_051772 [Chionoecetes opilio]|uniref:Uncharacterized protein n=1 Tax=Chionoecetes opilio TaxID=41210 RepID=A0A8J4Y226_CHIOP|nr:hypothetical protein GWK47_051772 [Chionoecetes opilio]